MSINEEWEKVKEFQVKFGHPISEKPIALNESRVRKRYTWMLEEINEFLSAKDIVEQADAMIDLIYFALGTLVEMGTKPEKLFSVVHNANMSKLWEDGKPHYKEDGKTLKPKMWKDPYFDLEKIINEMVMRDENK